MKKVSVKQSKINRELKKVYKEIELDRPHYCTGCGRSDVPLSHSHIIPRSRRPDLQTDKNNITYHCLSMGERRGCHEIWDSGNKDSLLDYHKNIEYILQNDVEYYGLITGWND
tara:strand:- start:438 stop:776 length:339 start_codon:yes stop_codon:yes gene_type:complete